MFLMKLILSNTIVIVEVCRDCLLLPVTDLPWKLFSTQLESPSCWSESLKRIQAFLEWKKQTVYCCCRRLLPHALFHSSSHLKAFLSKSKGRVPFKETFLSLRRPRLPEPEYLKSAAPHRWKVFVKKVGTFPPRTLFVNFFSWARCSSLFDDTKKNGTIIRYTVMKVGLIPRGTSYNL